MFLFKDNVMQLFWSSRADRFDILSRDGARSARHGIEEMHRIKNLQPRNSLEVDTFDRNSGEHSNPPCFYRIGNLCPSERLWGESKLAFAQK